MASPEIELVRLADMNNETLVAHARRMHELISDPVVGSYLGSLMLNGVRGRNATLELAWDHAKKGRGKPPAELIASAVMLDDQTIGMTTIQPHDDKLRLHKIPRFMPPVVVRKLHIGDVTPKGPNIVAWTDPNDPNELANTQKAQQLATAQLSDPSGAWRLVPQESSELTQAMVDIGYELTESGPFDDGEQMWHVLPGNLLVVPSNKS